MPEQSPAPYAVQDNLSISLIYLDTLVKAPIEQQVSHDLSSSTAGLLTLALSVATAASSGFPPRSCSSKMQTFCRLTLGSDRVGGALPPSVLIEILRCLAARCASQRARKACNMQ